MKTISIIVGPGVKITPGPNGVKFTFHDEVFTSETQRLMEISLTDGDEQYACLEKPSSAGSIEITKKNSIKYTQVKIQK